ncbi:MAG: AAA family ATPase [Bacteroidetes bacterium]|nr:AAA family ATPase [Bacteroidota bacterium]MBS1630852.1 AAA family ATPase [Bacteroidota bacterium]
MQIQKAIIVCGKIRAGKSTFASQIQQSAHACVASFGDYLKSYATERDLPTTRQNLQDIGERMINSSPTHFLKNVVQFSCPSANNVIFEGVRHLAILQAINEIAKATKTVYLDIPEEIRLERFLKSGKSIDSAPTTAEFYERSNHPVERDVQNLLQHSDYVFHNDTEIRSGLLELSIFYS